MQHSNSIGKKKFKDRISIFPHPTSNGMEVEITFADRVRNIVRKIPKGKTRTYKEVATAAGSPGAARAVGSVMRNNYLPDVPCHRVIKADGSLVGYNRGGVKTKRELLQAEGAL